MGTGLRMGSIDPCQGDYSREVGKCNYELWNPGFADPQEMISEGYQLISMNDQSVYIVPGASYYHDYLEEEKLYNEWTPAVIGKSVFEEKHPSILGGMFALWNDHVGNGITVKDIITGLFLPYRHWQ
mgnify:CR=1 FL=1